MIPTLLNYVCSLCFKQGIPEILIPLSKSCSSSLCFAAQAQMRKILMLLSSSLLIQKEMILIRLKCNTWRIFIFLCLYMYIIPATHFHISQRIAYCILGSFSQDTFRGTQESSIWGNEPSSYKETVFLAFVK